jgi:diamine N-acetyltransferase
MKELFFYTDKRKMQQKINFKIRKVKSHEVGLLAELAEKIWWPTYGDILSSEQLRYMLDTIYSEEALQKHLMEGTQEFFFLLSEEENKIGFAGISQKSDRVWKLEKIYVLPLYQGTGAGKFLLEAMLDEMKNKGAKEMILNVNKYNKAYHFYLKMGLQVIKEEDIPIGSYWMNDYVMGKEL